MIINQKNKKEKNKKNNKKTPKPNEQTKPNPQNKPIYIDLILQSLKSMHVWWIDAIMLKRKGLTNII